MNIITPMLTYAVYKYVQAVVCITREDKPIQ